MYIHSLCLILSSLGVFPLSSALKHAKHSAILEKQNTPRQWSKGARVQADVILPVRIALAGTNIERGEDFLMQMSDPSSSSFVEYWSPSQVVDTFAPSQETVNMTTQWLVDFGIDAQRIDRSVNRGFLIFNASAGVLEQLLEAEYFHYDHTTKGHGAVACEKYYVPTHLHPHIDYITPGISLRSFFKGSKPTTRIEKRTKSHSANNAASENCTGIPGQSGVPPSSLTQFNLGANLSICNNYVTPACLHALYGIPTNITTNTNNSMAVFEFTATYIQSDMDLFFQYVATNVPVTTQPIKMLINGAQITPDFNPQQQFVSEEANLDFQVSWSLVYPLNISLLDSQPTATQNLSIKEQGALELEEELFYALQDAFAAINGSFCTENSGPQCQALKPPNVISFSYGTDELALSPREADRLCNEFLKIGLQGTTLVFASGDTGVGGQSGTCIGPQNRTFNTGSLASCPWALSVGATMIGENSTVHDPEVVASVDFGLGNQTESFTSGGGFSLYHSAPRYQQSALDTYFNEHNPGYPSFYYTGNASIGANGGRYNRNGRGYPDVAANGVNILNVDNRCAVQQFGTSASAPIIASMITLINNERLNAGKRSVGFVNPTLYANPSVFHDIIEGHNEGCGTQGFEAVTGWDPVTGLGTINFPKLLEVFMELP